MYCLQNWSSGGVSVCHQNLALRIFATFDSMSTPYKSKLDNATLFPWSSSDWPFSAPRCSHAKNTVWLSAVCDMDNLICQDEAIWRVWGTRNPKYWSKSYSRFFSPFLVAIRYRQYVFILTVRLAFAIRRSSICISDNLLSTIEHRETGRKATEWNFVLREYVYDIIVLIGFYRGLVRILLRLSG